MTRLIIALFAFWIYFNDPNLKPRFTDAYSFAIYEHTWDVIRNKPAERERIITFLDRNGNIMIELPLDAVKGIKYVEMAL